MFIHLRNNINGVFHSLITNINYNKTIYKHYSYSYQQFNTIGKLKSLAPSFGLKWLSLKSLKFKI